MKDHTNPLPIEPTETELKARQEIQAAITWADRKGRREDGYEALQAEIGRVLGALEPATVVRVVTALSWIGAPSLRIPGPNEKD